MQKLIPGLLFCAALMPVAPAQADDLDRLVQSLCDYTKANDRANLRKKLKSADVQLRRVYGGVTCGADGAFPGGSLLRVTVAYGAADAAEFIVSQVGADTIKAPEQDGKSVVQWGEQFNGDASKKAVVDLLKAAG